MNLLGKILKSSQRGEPRPWFSHRYIGRLLLLAIAIFCYEYYSSTQPRSFEEISTNQILNIGYLKTPDTAFESFHKAYGFQYDILSNFAKQYSLKIKLHQINPSEALIGLNTNQFDLLIGHFPKQTNQIQNPFSSYLKYPLIEKKSIKNSSLDNNIDKENGQTKSFSNQQKRLPYQESEPWYSSNALIFEYKEAKTPKTKVIPVEQPIYYENGFPIQNINFSNLNFQSIEKKPLLESISKNEIKYGITTLIQLRISQKFISKLRTIKTYDEKIPLVWLFPNNVEQDFLNEINAFIRQKKTQQLITNKSRFWLKEYQYINYLDILSIHKDIRSKLHQLQPIFLEAGEKENISWSLLAALAFQESKWNIDAVSPTNVRGLMQLTQATADALGVKDRTDPNETVLAAAKHIRNQEKIIPIRVKRSDRIWLAIAAYNLGIGRIMQAYKAVRDEKKGEIIWEDISKKLANNSKSFQNNQYSTGKRTVEYVERIREFQEILRYYSSK